MVVGYLSWMKVTGTLTTFRSLGLLTLFVAFAAFTLWMGQNRLIARDEGFYLYAARLVQEGFLPYRDFFFPQTPLSPMVYSAWFDLVGTGWKEARVFASLLTILSGALLFLLAQKVYGRVTAVCSLVLFGLSVGVEAWLPTAQTNAFSVFFLLASLVAMVVYRNMVLAGAIFGLAVASRLTVAPLGVVLLLELFRYSTPSTWKRNLTWFAIGGSVSVAMTALIFFLDPENFISHNLEYHFERTGMSPEQIQKQLIKVLSVLFGASEGVGLGGFQFQFVLYAGIVGLVLALKESVRRLLEVGAVPAIFAINPFLFSAATLFFVHTLPEPTYVQYFCLVLVFMIPPAAKVLVDCAKILEKRVNRTLATSMVALVLVAYGAAGLPDYRRFVLTGDGVIGVGNTNREAWRMNTVSRVSRAVDSISDTSTGFIFASWPGYCVETKLRVLPGIESQFGPQWARNGNLSKDEQNRRKVLSWDRALKRVRKGTARVAVIFLGRGRTNNLEQGLRELGARREGLIAGIAIYRKQV